MDVEPNITVLPTPSLPTSSATITHPQEPYSDHGHSLIIDNGSTSLRWGFSSFATPNWGPNIVAKYKERRTNKPLLLFGEGLDVESGARAQGRTPWEGDVLLNFDALVSGICRSWLV